MSNAIQTYQRLGAISSRDARNQAVEREQVMYSILGAPEGGRMAAYDRAAQALGCSRQTVTRIFLKWQKTHGDIRSLADGRKATAQGGSNPYLQTFLAYCENDKNTSKNAWRVMVGDFRGGKEFPFGNWRTVWMAEHPGERLPSICPCDWVPTGMGYANLQGSAKENPDYLFNIAVNRHGRRAAQQYLVPVLRSRVGLKVGQFFQYDDVWHNTDVFGPGGKACQPLEFACYDISSAFKCSSLIKPRFVRADGKRDNLKEQQFRFLFAYDHICRGFHKDGVTSVCEHGTTAIRDNVKRQIAMIPGFGPLIRIQESGILSEQARAGLFAGCGGGNFRMKALCEGAHNILHNATAHLEGGRGRDAEHLHESQANLVKYAEATYALAAQTVDPAFAAKLDCGLLQFSEYVNVFNAIERSVMDRTDHRLEGWDGRMVAEYRLDPSGAWRDASELAAMGREEAMAIAAVVSRDPANLRRCRRMSRREAWMAGQDELVRVPSIEMPAFLDAEKDFLLKKVGDDGLLGFRNELYYGGDEMIYRAHVKTREGYVQAVAPGTKVMVAYNPLMREQVWLVSPEDGRTLGMAKLKERAPWYDREAVERALGEQSADLAAKLRPMRGRHLEESVAAIRRVAATQGAIAAAKAAKSAPAMMGDAGHASLDELAAAGVPDVDAADGQTFEEYADPAGFLAEMNLVH